ncbi:MAG TPA: hypothetical protein VMS22_02370 [Candidatus Eisenbacteria bacterium]|nr:hypothetical protein [Candidatus Eisenbacteria bacterium]
MVARAEAHTVLGAETVPVLQAEDVIGLKVQASSNDPRRVALDMADVERLIVSRPGLDLGDHFRL